MEKPSRDRIDLASSKDAVTAQRQVSETTNDLLKKNSEMLKISAIETAKMNVESWISRPFKPLKMI